MDMETLKEVEERLHRAVRELPEGSDWYSGMFDAINVIRKMTEESK